MMAGVPMIESSFAQSAPPMPNDEDGEHEGKTCPFTGKSTTVNYFTNS